MEWTVRYYLHQAEIWEDRGIQAEFARDLGSTAYAHRMIATWRGIAQAANARFRSVNQSYKAFVIS